jgi:hypothetical protein
MNPRFMSEAGARRSIGSREEEDRRYSAGLPWRPPLLRGGLRRSILLPIERLTFGLCARDKLDFIEPPILVVRGIDQ